MKHFVLGPIKWLSFIDVKPNDFWHILSTSHTGVSINYGEVHRLPSAPHGESGTSGPQLHRLDSMDPR